MSFKTVSFAVVAAILLGGCAFWQSDPKPIAPENTSKKAGLSMFNKTLNDVKLPQKIAERRNFTYQASRWALNGPN